MKNYTPLDGLRWSRNSDSALNNVPQTDVLGRAGGVKLRLHPRAYGDAKSAIKNKIGAFFFSYSCTFFKNNS